MQSKKQQKTTFSEEKASDHLAKEPMSEIKEQLGWSEDGLAPGEAKRRLEQYGFNELAEHKQNPLLKFLSYFWGPIPWMIEAAAVLSAVLRDWSDCAIIFTLLIMNVGIGFWEEFKADGMIEALKKKLAHKARVKRNGKWEVIEARELVPGDFIRLRLGDVIPADARLLGKDLIQVDQSALTGESLPVERKEGDAVYSGAVLKQGETDALVYATAENTYMGKTARLAQEKGDQSHFQKAVLKVGDFLIILAVALVALILTVALFRGDRMLTSIQFALILTVAAIPVAMPTVLTITMAVGARLLARREAVVSRLAAIEELAGIDVLCSDKTGTLTQNKLTLDKPYTLEGVDSNQILLAAALASRGEDDDPIDAAVIKANEENGLLTETYEIAHFQPFDPVSKRTEAKVKGPDGQSFKVSKGAPQVILELAKMSDAARSGINRKIDEFAQHGYRSLGVARTNENDEWQFLGVLPLFDPPREDSAKTIKAAIDMGVHVKMVTGDQMAIGREIAGKLGMGQAFLDASVFGDTKHHESGTLADAIEKADGFAQVFPEHKYHIVEVLQKRGHIVGMTGDGVNDAPALNKADCGIAVSGATDAARSAASIVLLTPGLSVIIEAIVESRKIFQRMNSYVMYRIAETIRVLLFMTLSILVFNFYPVTTIMIVLLAILNDGAVLSIAYDRVSGSDKPEAWNMPQVIGISSVLGIAGVIASFGLFYLSERTFHLNHELIQTLMYLKLSVAGHLTIFVTRTRHAFWSSRPAAILFWAILGTQAVATLIAVYGVFMPPIGWRWALLVWGYALAWFLVNDRIKLLAYRIFDKEEAGLLAKT